MSRLALLGAGKPPVAAAGGGWTSPLNASTPAVWWIDASNVASVTVSNPGGNPELVTVWGDLGTGAHNLTTTVLGPQIAVGAVNGRRAILMPGGGTMKTAAFAVAQPFMLVAIWKQSEAPNAYGILFDGDRDQAAAGRAIVFASRGDVSNHVCMYAGTTSVDQGVSLVVNTNYHYRGVFNAAASTSVLNASSIGPINPGTSGVANGICVGAGDNGAGAALCEMFIIPNPIAADATNAAAYTLAKWGV